MLNKVFSKRNVLFLALAGALLVAILYVTDRFGLCDSGGILCEVVLNDLNFIVLAILFVAPPILLFSAVTYFLREEVFRSWVRFSLWWIPLPLAISYALALGPTGGNVGSLDGVLVVLMYWLYIIISLLIILVQSIRVYWLKK